MHAYRIVWEDEAQGREIELFADYSFVNGIVDVQRIRATKVTFYNAETKQAERTVNVHTETGRNLLVRQYLAARGDEPSLADEIFAQHNERDENLAVKLS